MASVVMVAAAVQEDLGGSTEEWVAKVVLDPRVATAAQEAAMTVVEASAVAIRSAAVAGTGIIVLVA